MVDLQVVAPAPVEPAAEVPLEQLEAQVVALACELFAVEAGFLAALAEFDRRGGWVGVGMRSCAHWLNWRCGLDLHTARERVRVARRLQRLPVIAESFARGEVSYSKVRAMTRIATEDNEAALLEMAHAGTASQLERIVRATARAEQDVEVEQELAEREGRPPADPLADVLTRRYRPDGRVEYRLVVSAEDDALIFAALRAAKAEAGVPEPGDVPAGTSPAAADFPVRRLPRQWAPFDERAAAALATLAESYLASGPQARRGDERYQVHVHVDADVLSGGQDPDLLCHAEVHDGPALPVHVLRRIACDALLTAVADHHDGTGTAGSPARHIPRWMRRALRARDGGCRFPGCPQRTWVDAHHIRHWADGGPTELWNLVLLCRFHHGQVHEHGYRLTLHPTGRLDVHTPDGTPIHPAPTLPGATPHLTTRHVDQPAGVWLGQSWDLGLAVQAVLTAHATRPSPPTPADPWLATG